VTRGSVQQQQSGARREAGGLQHSVVAGLSRRRDQLVELSEHVSSEQFVAATALAANHARRAAKRCLVIAASDQRLSRIDQLIQQQDKSAARVAIVRLNGTVAGKVGRTQNRPMIMLATAEGVIDHLRRDDLQVRTSRLCIVDAVGAEKPEQFGADLQFIYTKLHAKPLSVAFVPEASSDLQLLLELLRRPVTLCSSEFSEPAGVRTSQEQTEEHAMSDLPFSESDLKERISDILHEIHESEDPIEMTKLKRLVRKHTSLFSRSYITAYLLKQAIGGGAPARSKRRERSSRSDKHETENRDQQSIFVSIGRNRRVHTRDLITFFTSADGITSDDIGQIKVLDNYSFVEVNKEKAQSAIEALNGQELRGRKLTVNFARRK
jgi:hypothetical protein